MTENELLREIKEDSVVLSREEYEKLKTDNEVLGVELERTSTLLVNARKETAEKIFFSAVFCVLSE